MKKSIFNIVAVAYVMALSVISCAKKEAKTETSPSIKVDSSAIVGDSAKDKTPVVVPEVAPTDSLKATKKTGHSHAHGEGC